MINPWSSSDFFDYERLKKEFGISDQSDNIDHFLFRRKVILGQRGFEYIKYAIDNKIKFNVMTGLMPSGEMHLGNKSAIDQVIYFQKLGGSVSIAVADLESYSTRGIPLDKAREIAIEKYILNYIAMGLQPCEIYFQSKNKDVQFLSYILGNWTNMNELKALYGFTDSNDILHINAPLIQAADVLHTQLNNYGGPAPTVVPVGFDQDPHIRLMRDLAKRMRIFNVFYDGGITVSIKGKGDSTMPVDQAYEYLSKRFSEVTKDYEYRVVKAKDGKEEDIVRTDIDLAKIGSEFNVFSFIPPSATYQKLMKGLKGGKMSSSVPDSLISMNDDVEEAKRKIMRALTGGRDTEEEQRKLGGEPEKCPVFDLYNYEIDDDKYVNEVFEECKSGKRMCGYCKREIADKMSIFLKDIKEKREIAREKLSLYIHE
ncbi:tRNA synthetase Trp [Thermoplasma volcanium GSS1]|uniref:Tryptophan--tRNA ligase n=1 Tax=Thermoplasma volcanium (strain ATCC 51530 / DSM 4299 / JCM 9571 / NBRC 15438 / GSS1) TaxID=273116 RepID=SYW_THEVO|nr:tryptophan--tRNA ligase [Thermoplasma volcanium]Q978Y8.1 RecName: Full=Tryptophan--tRNA ligase; AltName: Full=Tryptophanyl-tRNA synthetase; Short=TrpRS [Thermoplasma volcanium GSS1]BAB60418.1 tRNA synthetase Trp [Thermoplasma volcanium GSS1]